VCPCDQPCVTNELLELHLVGKYNPAVQVYKGEGSAGHLFLCAMRDDFFDREVMDDETDDECQRTDGRRRRSRSSSSSLFIFYFLLPQSNTVHRLMTCLTGQQTSRVSRVESASQLSQQIARRETNAEQSLNSWLLATSESYTR
jgi:hypothetical protein